MNSHRQGFVVSLDFELAWGVRDLAFARSYLPNLIGGLSLVPSTLALFESFGIRATWAVVGSLQLSGPQSLRDLYVGPSERLEALLSNAFLPVGESRELDQLHFAPRLASRITETAGQETGSHTLLHTHWHGTSSRTLFADDLASLARLEPIGPEAVIVFPRNLYDEEALAMAAASGFSAFRGVPETMAWHHTSSKVNQPWRRALRLTGSFVPQNRRAFSAGLTDDRTMANVRASRFLRPPTGNRVINRRLVGVVKHEMSIAAANNLTYHLWWHPHNHGARPETASGMLESILDHFQHLQREHDWPSLSMASAAHGDG